MENALYKSNYYYYYYYVVSFTGDTTPHTVVHKTNTDIQDNINFNQATKTSAQTDISGHALGTDEEKN